VKLVFLAASQRPTEQLDKRPPWKAEGRTMQEQLSRSRAWVHIIKDVYLTTKKLKRMNQDSNGLKLLITKSV
jgi:hypothetical protein|tara:strand:- start:72 stop:287 length:216 start_codon:yes stop_codon:yes gene_type:complete